MSSYLDLGDLDGIVISCPHPFRASDVCLACLHSDGRLELLTGAWERLLGYRQDELDGRPMHSLVGERDARRLLDPQQPDPVLIEVLAKGGIARMLSVHRQLDDYEPSLYLACEPFEGRGAEMSLASRILSFASRP